MVLYASQESMFISEVSYCRMLSKTGSTLLALPGEELGTVYSLELLNPLRRDVRLLAEKFHPSLLHAWIMFGCFDKAHEGNEAVHKP